jgi:hypothetical protein
MVYASSKDALRRALVGVGSEIQGTDYSEVAKETGAPLVFTLFLIRALIILFPGSQWRRRSSAVRMLVGLPGSQVATRSIHCPFRLFE